ncbi:MAG: flavodoxin family protein, partial [Deltaproteobacteria bacterium]|nr:flavodoxin family protein [Deltaproteobacteria bacterium]
MMLKTVKIAYFSPTKTTMKILEGIAEGLEAETVQHIDLTLPEAGTSRPDEMQAELVLLGVPVYEGRVAKAAIPRLQQLKGNKTPVVVVVLYGNRDFEDALLELGDLAWELGFFPVAGGAFIGEHSFATETRPMANGRPDMKDITEAKAFGSRIRTK